MPQVTFYKGSYTAEQLLAKCQVQGAIVFDNATNRIYAGTYEDNGTTKPKRYGSNLIDASFDNQMLSITRVDDPQNPIQLDFSDVASASGMMDAFKDIMSVLGTLNSTHDAPVYTNDTTGILNVQSVQNLTSADQALANAIYANNRISNYVAPLYQTTGDDTFDTAMQTNTVQNNDALQEAINKLDNKEKAIVDAMIDNEEVTEEAFAAIKNSVGLDNYFNYSSQKTILQNIYNVHDAIDKLADEIGTGAVHDVKINGSTIVDNAGSANIVADGVYNSTSNKLATQSTVTNAINALDSTATIATVSNDVVTLKAGLTETDGIVTNDSNADIVLAKVAKTGKAEDVSIDDVAGHTVQSTVEGAINEIYTKIEALEGSFNVIVSKDAGTTPAGVKWINDSSQEITGTLVASADTFHKIYLVKGVDNNGQPGTSSNSYAEYITTRDGEPGSYTYGWEKLGDIDIDLTGYVQTVTINGKTYAVDTNSTNVTLTDVITSITGETAISGGNSDYVAVSVQTTKNTTAGTNITDVTSTVKIEEVADGLTKDNSPSYTSGHYVIEDGKLVSAAGKSSGNTYTISADDGLTTASDVQAYVRSSIANALEWSEWA